MPGYTREEYADMLLAYGAAHSNARKARRIYQERYPNRRLPDRDTFPTTYRRFRETGNLNVRVPQAAVRQLPVEIDQQILAAFEEDPTTSTRVVAAALGVSQWKVWSVMHGDHQHPYHYTPVQGLKQNSTKDWTKIIERRGNGPLLRENSLKLLSNSTACVFQWNKSRYRCFCCNEPFSDISVLKQHTNKSHGIGEIERKIITQQNRLVKVEISTLFCKICEKQYDSLVTLKTHLTTAHDLILEQGDLLVPFKIEGELNCQICSINFTFFRHLNIHMNNHYQKHVCHMCGAGFSNLVFLSLHKTRSHRPFECKTCNETFKDRAEKRNHDVHNHGFKSEKKLRYPCPYCDERFFHEKSRIRHLVEIHGMKKPEHKCSICSKVFLTRSVCNNHVKVVHMKEKSHECDICHNYFYTKSDVSRHRITHSGEKNYSCEFCNNPYASKDSLRRHVKRTHEGIK